MNTPPVILNGPETSAAAAGGGDGCGASGELNGSIHGAAKDPEAADDLIKARGATCSAVTRVLTLFFSVPFDVGARVGDWIGNDGGVGVGVVVAAIFGVC